MASSQVSQGSAKFGSKFILRDTMGPTLAGAVGGYEASGNSSNTSSVRELSSAEAQGLRSSFREHAPGSLSATVDSTHEYGMSDNQTPGTSVSTEDVHVLGFRGDEIRGATPDSTASSTKRFFLSASGKTQQYSVGNLKPAVGMAPGRETPTYDVKPGQSTYEYDNTGFIDTADENVRVGNMYGKSIRAELARQRPTVGANNTYTHHMNNDHSIRDDTVDNDRLPGDRTKLTDEEGKPGSCLPRCGLLALVIVILVAGVVVLIFLAKEKEPNKKQGAIIQDEKEPDKECLAVKIPLQQQIAVECRTAGNVWTTPSFLRVTPPVYVNNGSSFVLNLKTNDINLGWNATFSRTQRLTVHGPAITCSSSGRYKLEFLADMNRSVYNTSVKISVHSEVLQVNVSLEQPVNETESSDFKIGCSTSSGCEQSYVDFFAEINQEEQYLRGVNFSCTIDYNDYDGYRVACIGSIPDYLISHFEKITCRPRSTLLDDLPQDELNTLEQVLELPDCDIAQHCGYKCKSAGDYYVVNSGRCDIFHRCYDKVVYTTYCAPGTFFDPATCACSHKKDLPWCQPNGALKPGADVADKTCIT